MADIIFPKDINESKKFSKLVAKGKLKRIRKGMYTNAAWEDIPQLVNNKWAEIVHSLFPQAIASHSTAALLYPKNKIVHITANVKIRRRVSISDLLIIEVHPGNTKQLIEPFTPFLNRSEPARFLLENLLATHKDSQFPKALGQAWVESELCKVIQRRGEKALNEIREKAKQYSIGHNLQKEFKLLNQLISAILTTHSPDLLVNSVAIAMANNIPFDKPRIDLFKQLASYLNLCQLKERNFSYSKVSWRNLAFYESYFSNYIEGTEFEIDEAAQIVFEKQEIQNRHRDSHDVLSVFEVVEDYTEMSTLPNNAQELIQLLKARHALIMHARPNKNPGNFKQKINKAGNSVFVDPQNVEGTLIQAFEIYQQLPCGMARAIFIHFLITECHPFDDGNGRLARIMMNSELVAQDQHKLIVPIVHRDSYLNGLRQATRRQKFRTMVKVLIDLQAYTSIIPWEDYNQSRETLLLHYADRLPDEGVAVFNKQIAQFKTILPVG